MLFVKFGIFLPKNDFVRLTEEKNGPKKAFLGKNKKSRFSVKFDSKNGFIEPFPSKKCILLWRVFKY